MRGRISAACHRTVFIASAARGFHFYYIAGNIGKDATGCNVEDPASITAVKGDNGQFSLGGECARRR